MKLTPEQKRILLTMCNAAEHDSGRSEWVALVVTQGTNPIRETTTAMALVRKGLAERSPSHPQVFRATPEGFWEGDTLRCELRMNPDSIPPRRTS